MQSAIYQGKVWHQRYGAPSNKFAYDVSYLYLDLAELPALLADGLISQRRIGLLSFRREDYLGDPSEPLLTSVHHKLAEHRVAPPAHIRMLTFARTLGYVFNPVTFYYCFDAAQALVAVVAEITNTPWNERHCYVAAVPSDGGAVTGEFAKRFHVSPFYPMNQTYRWQFAPPTQALEVTMHNHEQDARVFSAGVSLHRVEMSAAGLRRHLRHQPLASLGAHAAIYWQAARLALKRAPFFHHPKPEPGAP